MFGHKNRELFNKTTNIKRKQLWDYLKALKTKSMFT